MKLLSLKLLFLSIVLSGCAVLEGPKTYVEPSIGPTATFTGPNIAFPQGATSKSVSVFSIGTELIKGCIPTANLISTNPLGKSIGDRIITVKIPANTKIAIANTMENDPRTSSFFASPLHIYQVFAFFAENNKKYLFEPENDGYRGSYKLYSIEADNQKMPVATQKFNSGGFGAGVRCPI